MLALFLDPPPVFVLHDMAWHIPLRGRSGVKGVGGVYRLAAGGCLASVYGPKFLGGREWKKEGDIQVPAWLHTPPYCIIPTTRGDAFQKGTFACD